MLKMKKILGILLAVCFVLSVTAAAVSAGPANYFKDKKDFRYDNHRYDKKDRYDRGDRYDKKDRYDDKKRHYNPSHWGKERVGHREFRNHSWTVVYVYIQVFIKEYWTYY
ncbi:MAG: hypothetical protein WB014_10170 [Methanosarcina sp.]